MPSSEAWLQPRWGPAHDTPTLPLVLGLPNVIAVMLRSYHPEQTRSHQNSEVNLDWAASVLGREITWEPAVS